MSASIAYNAAGLRFIGRWQDMSTYMLGINGGLRLRFKFTGTSLTLNFLKPSAGSYGPRIEYSIDGGSYVSYIFGLGTEGTSVPVAAASGLASGAHTCDLWVAGVYPYQDRWTVYTGSVRFTGLTLDTGAAVSDWPAGTRKSLVVGDSISEGQVMYTGGPVINCPQVASGRLAYGSLVAAALGSENINHAFGGAMIATTSLSIPGAISNVAYKMGSYAQADPTPLDYIIVAIGHNGGANATQYGQLLDAIRAIHAAPPIFCLNDLPGWTDITSAINTAIATRSNCYLVNSQGWGSQLGAYDAALANHPNEAQHATIAGLLTPIISSHISTTNVVSIGGAGVTYADVTADIESQAVRFGVAGKAYCLPSATLAVSPQITPAITWDTPIDVPIGSVLGAAQLNASATVPGTFSYNPPSGTVLGLAGSQILSATFTPTDTVTYATTTVTNTVLVYSTPPLPASSVEYEFRAINSTTGALVSGLTPAFVFFQDASGGALAQPTIHEVSTGVFHFTYAPTVDASFRVDLGSAMSAADRYVDGVCSTTDAGGGATVEQIDTALTASHGSGSWQNAYGYGSTAVNENTGGTDNLRYVDSTGNGVDNANITVYLAADFYAGHTTSDYVKGNSTTKIDGRWYAPIMLDAGFAYVVTFCKQGVFNTSWKEFSI